MEDLIWQELKNGESDVDAEPINKLAEYVKKLNTNKVDKEGGKGLSTNDFTDELKEKLEGIGTGGSGESITVDTELNPNSNNAIANSVVANALNNKVTIDDYVDAWDYDKGGDIPWQEHTCWDTEKYKNLRSTCIVPYYRAFRAYMAYLIFSCNEDGNGNKYQLVIDDNGEVWRRYWYEDPTDLIFKWSEWTKVSVSQTDLTNAIGDIEASLENIITKYGLGGDSV